MMSCALVNFLLSAVAKLVSALLATQHPAINQKLMECKTIDILLVGGQLSLFDIGIMSNFLQDLFFKYSLNNFLHREVERSLEHIFAWNPHPKLPKVPEGDNSGEGSPTEAEKMDTEEAKAEDDEPDKEEEYENPLLTHVRLLDVFLTSRLTFCFSSSPTAVSWSASWTRGTRTRARSHFMEKSLPIPGSRSKLPGEDLRALPQK